MIKIIKKLRNLFLVKIKWRKYKIGKNFHAGRSVFLWAKHKITIGNNFYIGKFSQIEIDAEIGDNVILANRVAIIGRYDHNYQEIGVPVRLASHISDKNYNWKGLDEKVIIEDDVWVGYGAVIIGGVKINRGSIIAAGSVVTKDVEPFSIYACIPAKKIKNRFDNENDLQEHVRLYNLKYKKR